MRACANCRVRFSPTSLSNVCCSRDCAREFRGDFASRFWARVNKNGPIAPGMKTCCWLWTGKLESNGYARVKRQDSRNQVSVHRAAWEMKHGEVPTGMQVLHRCDVRSCVRHLFLGTQRDNMQGMLRKGRANKARGSAHGRSKLTEKNVLQILKLRGKGWTLEQLSVKFGVGTMQVSRICGGKRWAHLQTRQLPEDTVGR
jgi:hypothetical protein